MEQNQTAPAQPVNPVVQALEQAEPVQPSSMPMQAGPAPKKKSSAIALSIVLLLILALGGIGFGVWAYMDGNSRVEAVKKQYASSDVPETTSRDNPVIQDSDSTIAVSVWFESSDVLINEAHNKLEISIEKGKVNTCKYGVVSYSPDGSTLWSDSTNCNITVSGDIYKVVEFGAAGDNGSRYVGFLMTDGTINYFPLTDALQSNDFSIKGQIELDDSIVDVIDVSIYTGDYGFASSLFVLGNGDVVDFSKDMIK